MITIDYMGEGVENWQKIDYVICERSLINIFMYISFKIVTFFHVMDTHIHNLSTLIHKKNFKNIL